MSKTQTMDRSLKVFYNHSIIKRYNASIDGGRSPTKVNRLEAMTFLTAAWECVSAITLINCFRKTVISSEGQARREVYNRYFWHFFFTYNFYINKKAYVQIFTHTPNISYDPIHTKNNYVKKGYLQTPNISMTPSY